MKPDSAAARLQRAHERSHEKNLAPSEQTQRSPDSLKASDFPHLASGSTFRGMNASKPQNARTKPSYADVATGGISKAESIQQAGHGIKMTQDPSLTSIAGERIDLSFTSPRKGLPIMLNDRSGPLSPEIKTNDSQVEIQGRQKSQASIKTSPSKDEPSNGRLPHFAQPTQSFARRANGTQRKDARAIGIAHSGSPPKSIKTVTQKHIKRASLPVDWMAKSSGQFNSSPASPQTDFERMMRSSLPPGPQTDRSSIPSSPANGNGSPESRELRTKTSSYMSPTKATAQRGVVVHRENSAKPKWTKSDDVSPHSLPHVQSGREVISHALNAVDSQANQADRIGIRGHESHVQMPSESAFQAPDTLPTIANTTTVRRISHGHILQPIKAKLEMYGLLNHQTISRAAAATKNPQLPSPKAEPLAGINANDNDPHGVVIKTKSSRSRRSTHTSNADGSSSMFERSLHTGLELVADMPYMQTIRCDSFVSLKENKQSQIPSLRATAQEFTPTHVLEQDLQHLSSAGILAYQPDKVWSALSPDVRESIVKLRKYQQQHQQDRARPPCDASNVSCLAPGTQKTVSSEACEAGTKVIHCKEVNIIFENNGWKAVLEDGTKIPATFNQAQLPFSHALIPSNDQVSTILNNTSGFSPASSSITATTKDAPSSAEPALSSPRSWTYSSPLTDGSYQSRWSGGNGREIKFTGDGPRAERYHTAAWSPPSPLAHTSKYDKSGPRFIGPTVHAQGSMSPPLAPRSRRQWAEMLGYPQVPCQDIEVADAMEMLPTLWDGPRLYGYCRDCGDSPY